MTLLICIKSIVNNIVLCQENLKIKIDVNIFSISEIIYFVAYLNIALNVTVFKKLTICYTRKLVNITHVTNML